MNGAVGLIFFSVETVSVRYFYKSRVTCETAIPQVDVAIRNVLALYDGAVQQAAYAAPRYAPPPGQPMQQMQQAGHPQVG